MRKIKFRAWVKENKGFVYAELVGDKFNIKQFPVFDGMVLNPKIKKWDQYTGLKDKNGEEIYEGDIVKRKSHYGDIIFQVIWSNEDCGFKLSYTGKEYFSLGSFEYEIIGNIYENPKLLK